MGSDEEEGEIQKEKTVEGRFLGARPGPLSNKRQERVESDRRNPNGAQRKHPEEGTVTSAPSAVINKGW